MKRILVVAGSDSSGGAGLEADQKVIAAHGKYAMTATAALTAQNTQAVYDIHITPPAFVQKQINACCDDVGVDVLKTGMLACADTIRIVADSIRKHLIATSVIDPVMVATSGSTLLPEDAVESLLTDLLPVTTLLTPNIPEAQLLLKVAGQDSGTVATVDDLERLAVAVAKLGPKAVLLKGGHLPLADSGQESGKIVHNIFVQLEDDGQTVRSLDRISFPFSSSSNTHGTGCSLASAIACYAADGYTLLESSRLACRYIDAGIRTAIKLGTGSGPINHFHSLQALPFGPGQFVEWLLERSDVKPAWKAYTEHEFVNRLGDGTLPIDNFKTYMTQDYLFLTQYARAFALAAYKQKTLDDVGKTAELVVGVRNETQLHIAECEEIGLTREMMDKEEESLACTAYTRYVLDIGMSEDWFALQIAMFPCLYGYGTIATRLALMQETRTSSEPNKYLPWIDNYARGEFQVLTTEGCASVDRCARLQSPHRIEQLVKIFIHATNLETGFWDMAMTHKRRI